MTEQATHRTAGDAGNAAKMERDLREATGKLPDNMAESIASILETGVQIRDGVQKNRQIIQKGRRPDAGDCETHPEDNG